MDFERDPTTLEKEAEELLRKNEALPAGKRLDLAQAYLNRCQARARKAAEAADAARQQLAAAESAQQAASGSSRAAFATI